jgi:hypothetical protein
MAGKLGTVARQVRPLVAVLPQDMLHPELGTEHDGKDEQRADRDQKGHGVPETPLALRCDLLR